MLPKMSVNSEISEVHAEGNCGHGASMGLLSKATQQYECLPDAPVKIGLNPLTLVEDTDNLHTVNIPARKWHHYLPLLYVLPNCVEWDGN